VMKFPFLAERVFMNLVKCRVINPKNKLKINHVWEVSGGLYIFLSMCGELVGPPVFNPH
jgi:hypothetical protein